MKERRFLIMVVFLCLGLVLSASFFAGKATAWVNVGTSFPVTIGNSAGGGIWDGGSSTIGTGDRVTVDPTKGVVMSSQNNTAQVTVSNGGVAVTGTTHLNGVTTVNNTLAVTGATTLSNSLSIDTNGATADILGTGVLKVADNNMSIGVTNAVGHVNGISADTTSATMTGGTGTTTWTLTDTGATLHSGAIDTFTVDASGNAATTGNLTVSGGGINSDPSAVGQITTIGSTNAAAGDVTLQAGTTNKVTVNNTTGTTVTGALTSNGNVTLNTNLGNPGNASLNLNNGSNSNISYTSATATSTSGLNADGTNLVAGYITSSSISGINAYGSGFIAGYLNTNGNNGGLTVSDSGTTATTVINGGNLSTGESLLSLNSTAGSLLTSDNSGLTVNTAATGSVTLQGGATGTNGQIAGLSISQDGNTVSVLNNVGPAVQPGHGLTIGANTTTLTGGTNSSSLTLQDSAATLEVGTSSSGKVSLIRATNTTDTAGGSTNVSIGEVTGNRINVNSLTGTTVNGNLSVTGTTTTNSISNAGDITTDTLHTNGSATLNSAQIDTTLNVDGLTTLHGITNTGSLTSNSGNVNLNTSAAGSPGNASLSLTSGTGASLQYTNSLGNTHGMKVGETSTVISGGTHSTTLTLDDSGVSIGSPSGNPLKLTNVADGTNDHDAVNYHQMQKAYIGVASVSALTSIPSALPGKRFALGAGYGYFEGENAVAVGLKARIWDNVSVSAGAGIGVGYSTGTFTANAGFSYSF